MVAGLLLVVLLMVGGLLLIVPLVAPEGRPKRRCRGRSTTCGSGMTGRIGRKKS